MAARLETAITRDTATHESPTAKIALICRGRRNFHLALYARIYPSGLVSRRRIIRSYLMENYLTLRVKLCHAPMNTRWHVLVIVLRLCLNITGASAVEGEVKSRCERRGRFITSKGRLASPRWKTKPAITVIPSAR